MSNVPDTIADLGNAVLHVLNGFAFLGNGLWDVWESTLDSSAAVGATILRLSPLTPVSRPFNSSNYV